MEPQKDAAGAPVHLIGHTPGPWAAPTDIARGRTRCLVLSSRGDQIARVNDYREEFAADARLIAAAPDLLEALQSCRMHIETLERMHGHELPEGDMLREAIAKATGEVV